MVNCHGGLLQQTVMISYQGGLPELAVMVLDSYICGGHVVNRKHNHINFVFFFSVCEVCQY